MVKLTNKKIKWAVKQVINKGERKHSLSLVHADWLDYDVTQVIAYEDDASRKILTIGEFANATTDNAISVFKRAEDIAREYRGKITAVNTDRGTQFYASGGEKKKKGVSRFKQYLEKHLCSPALPICMTIGGDKRKNEKPNRSDFSNHRSDNRSSYSKCS